MLANEDKKDPIEDSVEHAVDIYPSSSDSSDFDGPVTFTGKETTELPRSLRGSFSSLRRAVNGNSTEDADEIKRYTEEEIRGSLDEVEFDLQRNATRQTIISHIVDTKDIDDSDYKIEEDRLPIENDGEKFTNIDPELITWGYNNPEDPRNWRTSKKVFVVIFVSLYTLISPMSSSILSPAMSDLAKDFNITSTTVQALVISIHILAWAVGPLVIAPLSEDDRLGRKTVLSVSCWLSLAFNLGCALSRNTTEIIVFRFISGLFSATPLNVSPAVVSDLFDAKTRNLSLAGVFLVPFVGPAIAPIIGGFMVEAKGWRWVLYTLCIINAVVAVLGTFFYVETYTPALLKKKAQALRKKTGNMNLHTIYEISNGETTLAKLQGTVSRPLMLLFTHPMIIGLGSFMAFIYGFLYLMIITFPSVFGKTYGFSQSQTGLMYSSLGIGFILGMLFWTYVLGVVYNHLTEKNNGVAEPEFRLPCLFIAAAIIPIGLLWYGWSAQLKLHWIMPCIGSAIFAFGLVCVFQTLQAYLIDMNPRFAASSIAAAAIFRCLFGFAFPLFAPIMYARLDYGWANTMCAIIAVFLAVPFPILCYKYGKRIREWANVRMEKSQEKRDERLKAKLAQKI
ncbi:CIC11C00000003614 [Sungouiella intermedia]|uniref:CIC11C00000003614 n=1 Tax=Sungouiella intermedia TaxID=45354 RepID=A0A1L0GLU8_9ASCO|nr:CIC11C00000003614 [[Candida] intermedia]